MSWLGDSFKFDAFQFKDMLKQIKKDPERLLFGMGTMDPLSTKLTNKVFNKDYEPLTDIGGGPYGGHTSSLFGGKDGGVYERAQAAGINTKPRGQVSDAANVIGMLFGAGAGLGAMGGASGAGGATTGGALGGGTAATAAPASAAILPEVVVTGSHVGSTLAPAMAGMPAAVAGSNSSGFDWKNIMNQMGGGGMGGGGGQQQPQQAPPMSMPARQLQQAQSPMPFNSQQPAGLGRVGATLQPQLTPEQLQRQMRMQKSMQMMNQMGPLA